MTLEEFRTEAKKLGRNADELLDMYAKEHVGSIPKSAIQPPYQEIINKASSDK